MKSLKIFFWILLIPTVVVARPAGCKKTREAVDCVFILSEPKSGLNWLTYCLQTLTLRSICRPTFEKGGVDNPLLKLDHTKSPLLCTHFISRLREVDSTKNRLILVFRNYKENTIRRCADQPSEYQKMLDKGTLFDEQAAKLRFYENWPEENRYLVYHEDLMENPEEILRGILHFLDEDDEKLEGILANIDRHKAKSLSAYENNMKKFGQSGPISRGKDILYHSKLMPQELLLQADELFKSRHPELWEKYLSRYASQPF